MKKITLYAYYRWLVLALLPFTACELDNPAVSPTACLEVYRKEGVDLVAATEAKVNQELVFKSCNKADYLVIWPGDLTGDYYNKVFVDPVTPTKPDGTPNNRYGRGIFMNGTIRQTVYKYSKPGTYTVVLLASNVGDDLEAKQSEATQTITITE